MSGSRGRVLDRRVDRLTGGPLLAHVLLVLVHNALDARGYSIANQMRSLAAINEGMAGHSVGDLLAAARGYRTAAGMHNLIDPPDQATRPVLFQPVLEAVRMAAQVACRLAAVHQGMAQRCPAYRGAATSIATRAIEPAPVMVLQHDVHDPGQVRPYAMPQDSHSIALTHVAERRPSFAVAHRGARINVLEARLEVHGKRPRPLGNEPAAGCGGRIAVMMAVAQPNGDGTCSRKLTVVMYVHHDAAVDVIVMPARRLPSRQRCRRHSWAYRAPLGTLGSPIFVGVDGLPDLVLRRLGRLARLLLRLLELGRGLGWRVRQCRGCQCGHPEHDPQSHETSQQGHELLPL
jgi:hypothetical protein